MNKKQESPMTTKTKPAQSTSVSDDSIISSLVINGDLSKLSPQQKVEYYRSFCDRLGLDPLSQPFKLLRLNGKEVMYCDRSGAQQLNKLHRISHEIKARETVSGCYVVTAQASTPEGRHTESIGAVPIDNMRGDALCNAMMKAETKAKRRATLDLLGLGILDETETETIMNAQRMPAPAEQAPAAPAAPVPAPKEEAPAVAAEKGEPATTATVLVAEHGTMPLASPFKTKYETVADVEKVLEDAKDIKDIANLYYINAELVETSAGLRTKFTEKKNEFYGRQHTSMAA